MHWYVCQRAMLENAKENDGWMLSWMITRMHHPLPNKQTHHAKVMSLDIKVLWLCVKCLDVKICGLMSRYVAAGVEGGRRCGCVLLLVYIYHPTKKQKWISANPGSEVIVTSILMVGKIQLWLVVGYSRIAYGRQNPVQGLGTKKPHVAGVWLELFPIWK